MKRILVSEQETFIFLVEFRKKLGGKTGKHFRGMHVLFVVQHNFTRYAKSH